MSAVMINSLFWPAACAIVPGLVSIQGSAQDDNFTPFVISGRIGGNRIEGEIVTGTRAPERTVWKAERQ